jgi:hypothetical protein
MENWDSVCEIMAAFQICRSRLDPTDSAKAGEMLNKAISEANHKRGKSGLMGVILEPAFYQQLVGIVSLINDVSQDVYQGRLPALPLSSIRICTDKDLEKDESRWLGEGDPLLDAIIGKVSGCRVEEVRLTGKSLPVKTDAATHFTNGELRLLIRDKFAENIVRSSGLRKLEATIRFAALMSHETVHTSCKELELSENLSVALLGVGFSIYTVTQQIPNFDVKAVYRELESYLCDRPYVARVFGATVRLYVDGKLLGGVGGHETNELITEFIAKPIQVEVMERLIPTHVDNRAEIINAVARGNFSSSIIMREQFAPEVVWSYIRSNFGVNDIATLLQAYSNGELPARFTQFGKGTFFL